MDCEGSESEKPGRYFRLDTAGGICLLIIITLYPFLNVLAISFNDPIDTMRNINMVIPRQFTTSNYVYIFKENNLIAPLLLSVLRTVLGAGLGVICTAMLAYVLSRKDFILTRCLRCCLL